MKTDGTIVVDTPEGIEAFRLLAIRGRLKLEMTGLKFRPIPGYGSTHSYVKRTYGFTGSMASGKVLASFEAHLREIGVLKEAS